MGGNALCLPHNFPSLPRVWAPELRELAKCAAATASAFATCTGGEYTLTVQQTRGEFATTLVMKASGVNGVDSPAWFGVGFGGDESASGGERMAGVWALLAVDEEVQERVLGDSSSAQVMSGEDSSLTKTKLVVNKEKRSKILSVTRRNTVADATVFDFGAVEGTIEIICAFGSNSDGPSFHSGNRGKADLELLLPPPAHCMFKNTLFPAGTQRQIANGEGPFVAKMDNADAFSLEACIHFCNEQDGAKYYSFAAPKRKCYCMSAAEGEQIRGKKRVVSGVLDTITCDGADSPLTPKRCITPTTADAASVFPAFALVPGGSGNVTLAAGQAATYVLGIWADDRYLQKPKHKKAFSCGVKMTIALGTTGGYRVSSVGAGAKPQKPPALDGSRAIPLWTRKRIEKATANMGARTTDATFRVELSKDFKISVYFVQGDVDELAFTSKKAVQPACLIDAISADGGGMLMSVWSAPSVPFPKVCGVIPTH